MHAKIVTFAAGAFVAFSNAIPLANKRDIVWVTEIETAVETVPVTSTVWVDPTGAPKSNGKNRHGHYNKHSSQQQEAQTTVEVKSTPTPSPETSSSEAAPTQAPAPSSYEAPAAPSSEEPAPAPSSAAEVEQTTSSTPEPAPVTTQAPAPEPTYEAPTTSYEAPATSSSAAPSSYAPVQKSSEDSGSSSGNPASGQSFTGELTYFTPGMGACGHTSGEGDKMVAVSEALFDQYTTGGNPNKNPLCGKTLTIKGADGADHKATIWDRCPGCAMDDLDLPQEFFNEVTTPAGSSTPADGRAHGIEWTMD